MKRRIFSIALALCLCMSIIPAAHAEEEVPTPQEVYKTLIGLKEKDGYREGTPWDNDNHKNYHWNGGPVAGNITVGDGCAAFAFELSDIAFGSLPARTFTTGNFQLSDVRSGDILRVDGNTHSVIVLQVTEGGAVVAEGNYHENHGEGVVHWGRTMSEEAVEEADYFITRYPEGYVPPDDPSAGEELGGGSVGNLTWNLTKAGTLTISGSGAMPDFTGTAPWSNYMDNILTVVLEDGVTSVGSGAFQNSKVLSVTIPDSVEAIGDGAFKGTELVSVHVPGSVRTIGDFAFFDCGSLVSASLSEGLETIGAQVFQGCVKLSSITLPASVRAVGDSAFQQCSELASAVFQPSASPEPVTVGMSMFAQCWRLSEVTLPRRVDCISDAMFMRCGFLTSVNIPEGTTRIGESAFASCPLSSIYIPASVEEIGISAFPLPATLRDVYFGGDEAAWNNIPKVPTVVAALSGATVHYGIEPPETPPMPVEHEHNWDLEWSGDGPYHWHECLAEGCGVTENSGKSGYGPHSYGDWVIDQNATASQSGSKHRTCTVCGYTQTERIPATGSGEGSGGSGGSGGGGGSYTPSGSTSTTNTTRNPDGSVTTTKTDIRTGTVTETTQYPDGSKTVVETQKDGTVTTRETDRTGNKTETVVKPDGSSKLLVEKKDGTTATASTSSTGRVEAEVRLSGPSVSAAQEKGEAIVLPIPEVPVGRDFETAPTVTVNTGKESPVKVVIPVEVPSPGVVAVITRKDGTKEVIKSSVPTVDGVAAFLRDGVTVKIVDNSQNFTDVPAQYWGADAIDFVSARELFSGTSATTFTPEAPMTRAMLMVVLARFDSADTSGGATWYEKAMEWAVSSGISDGSGPDKGITREQLVTMLWRYAGSPAATGALAGFTDADQIRDYAQEAMSWAVENGVISGFSNGRLGPQGQATRAQVAQILKNFMEM
ncbi:MAG: leucine-rich repeat protein [Oscillibacter sp.]|nr:leucine-rich repeat protein [Oscillibacter sp.]